MTPKVSIIIPAYNEEKTISRTLYSLIRQKTEHSFEVIVVDNNSSDDTTKIAKSFKKELNLKVISEKRKGRGVARATGFDIAKGKFLLSLDADTIAPSRWVENMVANFDKPKVVAVTGPWKVRDLSPLTNACINHLQEIANLPYRVVMGHYWLTGLNFGITRQAYKKAGGFDRTLNAHEDLELTARVRKLGKIKYTDDVVVTTSGRRYEDGLLAGLWDYQKTAISYFLLRDKSKILDDRR